MCPDWDSFFQSTISIFGCNAMILTKDHGVAIAGFVRHLFLREFGHSLARTHVHSFGIYSGLGRKWDSPVLHSSQTCVGLGRRRDFRVTSQQDEISYQAT